MNNVRLTLESTHCENLMIQSSFSCHFGCDVKSFSFFFRNNEVPLFRAISPDGPFKQDDFPFPVVLTVSQRQDGKPVSHRRIDSLEVLLQPNFWHQHYKLQIIKWV